MMTDADGCQGEDDENEDSPAKAFENLSHYPNDLQSSSP